MRWKKIHVGIEYLKLEFPFFFHIWVFLFLSSFLLPSTSKSSFQIWVFFFMPDLVLCSWSGPLFFLFFFFFFFFFLPNMFICSLPLSLYSLFFCSCPIWFVLACFTIEIKSCRLRFTFYKLESIRLEIYVAKSYPDQQVEFEYLKLDI